MTILSSHRSRMGARVTLPRVRDTVESAAPLLLGASILVQFFGSAAVYEKLYVDLHVYVLGGAALDRPGSLYDIFFPDAVNGQLPFTYPPFAAILFYPLHWLPFPILVLCWKAVTIAALYGIVRICQRMVGGSHREAMLWTAVGIWFEPIRNTLDLGQVNVFLVLAVLYAAFSSRAWLSGLLVGAAAGVKLTPAITGVYFLGARRWLAAVISAAVFLATIGLSAAFFPMETRRYFTELVGDVDRIGMVGFVGNQSWQGTASRIVGHDVGGSPLLLAAILGTALLALAAWRALGTADGGRDALGSLLVVQLFGLTVSPIAWAHHWVWVVPLIIWLIHGPWHNERGACLVGRVWIVLMVIGVPTFLSLLPQNPRDFSRPWYLAWGDAVYVPMTLVTLTWIVFTARRRKRQITPAQGEAARAVARPQAPLSDAEARSTR